MISFIIALIKSTMGKYLSAVVLSMLFSYVAYIYVKSSYMDSKLEDSKKEVNQLKLSNHEKKVYLEYSKFENKQLVKAKNLLTEQKVKKESYKNEEINATVGKHFLHIGK